LRTIWRFSPSISARSTLAEVGLREAACDILDHVSMMQVRRGH
jgi:hypothetical protein